MLDWAWVGPIGAGAICYGAGMLAWMKNPKSLAAGIFLAAMTTLFLAMTTGSLYPIVDQDNADIATMIAKIFAMFVLLTMALLWLLVLIFPVERKVSFRPLNLVGVVMVATVVLVIMVGMTAELSYSSPASPEIDDRTSNAIVAIAATLAAMTTISALHSMAKVDAQGKRSAAYFLIGFWLAFASAITWMMQAWNIGFMTNVSADITNISVTIGLAASGLLFAIAIAGGQMSIRAPVSEKLGSSHKTMYKLLHKYVYLVEEAKPEFSFKMFSDILKGRCFDCENDESFLCESLDCGSCKLPCPCSKCSKYQSRPQGFVLTRQFPKDVRAKYFLQTTPIMWLSTVSGTDNMDPAKMSLLTDYLVNFMEKSHNGAILVEGLEYLVTTNDFSRVLRAVDRWTETAMVSNSKLIISVDPRSFDEKELAMLERNRETVRPDASETWKIIPEPV
ncbi:MAG: DUF835 domain-containing protein [Candidatus Thermoplasmatota archaeon]|nr:DUF835 domain-containing protein [Candidatus Thermoplasmatota archaeon]